MTAYDKIMVWATLVLAVCAVGGQIWVIRQDIETAEVLTAAKDAFSAYTDQSTKTADALHAAQEAFSAYSFPVVKFSGYQWYGPEKLSCEVPAIGINVSIRNFSGVPVVLNSMDVDLRMGDRPILEEPAERSLGKGSVTILAPGEPTALLRARRDFAEIFSRMRGAKSDVHLNFDVIATYASMATGKCYRYTGTVTVLDDCDLPSQTFSNTTHESITPIECAD